MSSWKVYELVRHKNQWLSPSSIYSFASFSKSHSSSPFNKKQMHCPSIYLCVLIVLICPPSCHLAHKTHSIQNYTYAIEKLLLPSFFRLEFLSKKRANEKIIIYSLFTYIIRLFSFLSWFCSCYFLLLVIGLRVDWIL